MNKLQTKLKNKNLLGWIRRGSARPSILKIYKLFILRFRLPKNN